MTENKAKVTPTGLTPFWGSFRNILLSRWHVIFSLSLALVATLALRLSCWPLGAITIIAADAYLALLLWSATVYSAGKRETLPGLPMRESAVVVIPMIFVTLVAAFAAIYHDQMPGFHSRLGSAYVSLVNLGSFTYDAGVESSAPLKMAMAAQLLSGVLLLICALPLLVSRLTDLNTVDAPVTIPAVLRLSLPDGQPLIIANAKLIPVADGHELHVSLVSTKDNGLNRAELPEAHTMPPT